MTCWSALTKDLGVKQPEPVIKASMKAEREISDTFINSFRLPWRLSIPEPRTRHVELKGCAVFLALDLPCQNKKCELLVAKDEVKPCWTNRFLLRALGAFRAAVPPIVPVMACCRRNSAAGGICW